MKKNCKKNEQFMKAAEGAGQWLLSNQVTDKSDANQGRFLYCCNIQTGEFRRSTNWQTGMAITALLWLYNYTAKEDYLVAAERAARYILSLQVLEPDYPEYFGGFREDTPQTPWMTTRDATSAAWGLLYLYEATGKQEYLTASKRFADWQLEYGWQNGWPIRNILLKPRYQKFSWVLQNNAQAGAAGFFMQLSQTTGVPKYAESASRKLFDAYIRNFLEPSGEPHIFYDPIAKDYEMDKPGPGPDGRITPEGWFLMHRLNDDFAALGLLQGYQVLRNKTYLEAAQSYAGWAVLQQQENGGFGDPEVEVAASCIPWLLMELRTVTGSNQYDTVIESGLKRLLELQVFSDNTQVNGGFLCLDKDCKSDPGNWVNIRNTSYSIMALIKAATCSEESDTIVFGLNPAGVLTKQKVG